MIVDSIASIGTTVFLLIGTAFTLVAAIGLLKLNDPMTRLHAPTKAATVGIGAYLLASMCHSHIGGDGSFHELLILMFLFVTAPISANFIAKVNLHQRSCDMPPKPTTDEMWSTENVPEADKELAQQPNS